MAEKLISKCITSTILDSNDSHTQQQNPSTPIHTIGIAVRNTVQLTTAIILEFNGAMKVILPELTMEQQKQIREAFNGYHNLLIKSQKFLTRALILTARCTTAKELIESIDFKILEEMLNIIVNQLVKFHELSPIIEAKLKEERNIKRWKEIFALMTAIGLVACAIGAGVGTFGSQGFTKALKAFLVAGGSITGAAAAGTLACHMAGYYSEVELIKKNLTEIRNGLVQMTQNCSKMEGLIPLLSDVDNTKQDFINILKETQDLVNTGFKLLKEL